MSNVFTLVTNDPRKCPAAPGNGGGDHMLNRMVLEFFNFRNVDDLMREYTNANEFWGQQSKGATP